MRLACYAWAVAGGLVCVLIWTSTIFSGAKQPSKGGKAPTLDEVVKPPDRSLSGEEAVKLVELILKALRDPTEKPDLGYVERRLAVLELRKLGHKAAIPVLLRIARDKGEHKDVRASATRSLAHIPDKQIIPLLFQIAEEAEKDERKDVREEVSFAAKEMLMRLLGYHEDIDPKKGLIENLKLLWERLKDKINMRERVFYLKVASHG